MDKMLLRSNWLLLWPHGHANANRVNSRQAPALHRFYDLDQCGHGGTLTLPSTVSSANPSLLLHSDSSIQASLGSCVCVCVFQMCVFDPDMFLRPFYCPILEICLAIISICLRARLTLCCCKDNFTTSSHNCLTHLLMRLGSWAKSKLSRVEQNDKIQHCGVKIHCSFPS